MVRLTNLNELDNHVSFMDTLHEDLLQKLNNESFHQEYKEKFDKYKVGIVPHIFGTLLVFAGNLVYGKKPSYGKFQAVEVIARIPYQSWEMMSYLFLTAMYANEEKAIELTKRKQFSRVAQDNETMHVVVITQLAKEENQTGFIRFYLIPLLFALFYFLISALLYLVSKKSSLELNYMFESHAYEQYSRFIEENKEKLKQKNIHSRFLDMYGRKCANQYEFFMSVKNDELIHRNLSIENIT